MVEMLHMLYFCRLGVFKLSHTFLSIVAKDPTSNRSPRDVKSIPRHNRKSFAKAKNALKK